MLVGAHRRAVDHQRFQVAIAIDRFDDPLPYAGFAPALEPRVCRVPVPQCGGQVAPRRTRSHDPQHRLYKQAIVPDRRAAITGLARQERLQLVPLVVA